MQQGWTTADIGDLGGRVAVVTGANRGLGLIVARELARAGAEVIIGARNIARGDQAARQIAETLPGAQVTALQLDLADLASIRAFADRLISGWPGLDILVNNAAIAAVPGRHTTADGFELQFGTNHLGHFALTGLLMEHMRKRPGARVVSISAELYRIATINFADLQSERRYSRWRAYAQSKLATLLFALELDRRLHAAAIAMRSVAAHPGAAKTHTQPAAGMPLVDRAWNAFTNRFMARSPEEGALPFLYAATAADVPDGSWVGPGRGSEAAPVTASPGAKALDAEVATRLWSLSEELTGVSYRLAPATPAAAASGGSAEPGTDGLPRPGDTLENHELRTRLLWRETASSTHGERVAAELWMNSDAAERPDHLHPKMNEKLSVIAGRARVRVGDESHDLGPGESLDFPAGTPHGFGRANQDELHVLLEGWPALRWDEFTTKIWNIDMTPRGRPDMLRISLALRDYPDHMYMAAAPVPVQKALFGVLARVARLTGKRLD